jgi:hypothetical protein
VAPADPPAIEVDGSECFRCLTDRRYSEWGPQSEHVSEEDCLETRRENLTRNLAIVDADTRTHAKAKGDWRREVVRANEQTRRVPAESVHKRTQAKKN